jgi:hypothetical protein
LDVIILDVHRHGVSEVSSSSYGLSLSSKAGSHEEENDVATPRGSSSESVGELWPGIDLLGEAGLEGTSVVPAPDLLGDQTLHPHVDPRGLRQQGEGGLCVNQKILVDGALGSSSTPPRGCGGGSAKNKAARILADASRMISPRMRRSFVDSQYSPSIGMNWSEWEIILGELTCMGLHVKREPISEDEDQ